MKKIIVLILALTINDIVLCQETVNCGFNDFIASFPEWEEGVMDNKSIFFQGENLWGESLMNEDHVKMYIPHKLIDTCGCTKGKVAFNYGYKITKGKYYVCFMIRHCDTPNKEFYPYIDDIIVTYRKDGQIIDFAETARFGDLWFYDIKDIGGYENFVVAQVYYDLNEVWDGNYISLDGKYGIVQIKKYKINKKGKVKSKLIETFKAVSNWNGNDYDIDGLNKHKYFYE